MFADDRFSPTHIEDDDTSVQPRKNGSGGARSKVLAEISEFDSGLFRISRKVPDQKKKRSIVMYSSSSHGSTIRNAVTGIRVSGHIVGSKAEDLFFKVKFATGETGLNTATLFYDSPEQYEKHMTDVLKSTTKQPWHDRVQTARVGMARA